MVVSLPAILKRIGFIVSKVQASKLGASLDTTICWASSDPYPLDGLSYVLNAEWATTGTGLFSADKRTLKIAISLLLLISFLVKLS